MGEDMGQLTQAEKEEQKGKYVTFQSGDEYFGLKIQYVNEIIVFQDITPIPETADYIKGLINLRGKIIPVVDVRLRFGQTSFQWTNDTSTGIISSQRGTSQQYIILAKWTR